MIRNPCHSTDDKEGQEVWWSAETLALNGAEASHFRDDRGGEERKRCEADVGTKVAEAGQIRYENLVSSNSR